MVRIPTHGPPTHPGAMLLEEFLKPLGMSQVELAARIGVSFPRVNELIHAKRGVTPDTALRLERLFGMEAKIWLSGATAWGTSCKGMSANPASRSECERVAKQESVTKPQPNEPVPTLGLLLAEVARRLGVTTSAISEVACRQGGE